MPIGTSDGDHYESDIHRTLDLPTVTEDSDLSQTTQKREPLRLTVTPHLDPNEPASEEGEDHKVFFVRHGETPENEPNEDGHVTIREKDAKLTDKGRQQAEQAADKLKEEGITHLFSSTLPRAQESTNIISAKLGITPQFDPRLNTWGMGDLEGKPCTEENLAKIKAHMKETPDKPLGGEESFNDFKDRTFAGIRDSILSGAPGKTAILTHSKVEDALERWKKTGQDNPSLDLDSPMKEEKPGSIEPMTIEANSTIMQPATGIKPYPGKGPTPQSDTPFSRWAERMGDKGFESLKDIVMKPGEQVPMPGHLGIFGGQNALTAELGKLFQAKHMKYNTTAEPFEIFKKTGWYQDIDRHWKHFIPNEDTALVEAPYFQNVTKDKPVSKGVFSWTNIETDTGTSENPTFRLRDTGKLTLKDIYQNKNLFEAYPNAKYLPIEIDQMGSGYAQRDKDGRIIKIGLPEHNTKEQYLSLLQHEIQHFVQGEEGFPRGASSFRTGENYKEYYRTSGEVEARNATYWLNNPEKTKGMLPTETTAEGLALEGLTPKDIVVRTNRAGISAMEPKGQISYKDVPDKKMPFKTLREYINQGLSQREIALKHGGVSERTIGRWMKEYGLEPKAFIGSKSEVPIELIEKGIKENKSWAEMGREFNLVPNAVKRRAQRYGLTKQSISKNDPDWLKEELEQ